MRDICKICDEEHKYRGFIYKWINLKNEKWYIGSHGGCENDGYKFSSLILAKAVQKYGIENFERKILFYSFDNRTKLYEIESEILKEYNAANCSMSYNLKNTGIGGDPIVLSEMFSGVKNLRSQKVICLDTKEVFEYARLAAESVGGTDTGISEACHKGYKHRNKHWMFYEEYQLLGEPEENPRYSNSGKARWRIDRLSDGKIFESRAKAAKFYRKRSFPEETFHTKDRTFAGNYWMKYQDWVKAGYPIRTPPLRHHNTKDQVVDMVTGKPTQMQENVEN